MWIRKQFTCNLSAIVAVLFAASEAAAIPPPYVSDRSLAESPVIVVAKWDDAPWENNSLVEGNLLKVHERYFSNGNDIGANAWLGVITTNLKSELPLQTEFP